MAKKLDLILTNDDGHFAEGLQSNFRVLQEEHRCHIVAPLQERSTTGHSLNLRRPLAVHALDEHTTAVDGFPADCSYLALHGQVHPLKVDAVISGSNHGANLGQDIFYSGTVAAAREAALSGVKAIAISLVSAHRVHRPELFADCSRFLKHCLETGLLDLVEPGTFFNINYPAVYAQDIPGVKQTVLGKRIYHLEVKEEGGLYSLGGHHDTQEGGEHSDVMALEDFWISITPLYAIHESKLVADHIDLGPWIRTYPWPN